MQASRSTLSLCRHKAVTEKIRLWIPPIFLHVRRARRAGGVASYLRIYRMARCAPPSRSSMLNRAPRRFQLLWLQHYLNIKQFLLLSLGLWGQWIYKRLVLCIDWLLFRSLCGVSRQFSRPVAVCPGTPILWIRWAFIQLLSPSQYTNALYSQSMSFIYSESIDFMRIDYCVSIHCIDCVYL